MDAAVDAYGRLDIVVNNVGGSGARDFAGADADDFRAVLDRNLFPALLVSRAAQPYLEVQGGVIVMITSIYGREAGGGPSYNAAKAAEISLAKAMARELAARKSGCSASPRARCCSRAAAGIAGSRPTRKASPPSSPGRSPGAASGASRRSPTW